MTSKSAKAGSVKPGQGVDAAAKPATPPPMRRFRLTSCRGVRGEMAAVYADARCGRVDTKDAARLIYCLSALRVAVADDTFEQRLAALEQERP